MNQFFEKLGLSVKHLKALNDFFANAKNYQIPEEQDDFNIYQSNLDALVNDFSGINVFEQLYNQKDRQMILADLFEYILLSRGFYAIGTRKQNISNKQQFVKGILHFTNLLMCFESITVNTARRNLLLDFLAKEINSIKKETGFKKLRNYAGEVGMPDSGESKEISSYFDKLLPKTAGGLWHELLVYIFVIRNNLGFILPLLLHQKLYSKDDHLVPPDFLILTKDKRVYGIEVGIKKEIQSGSFSLKTAIPTATIDTINSRNSDRCPICKKWINFCPLVIEKFADFNSDISRVEVKCLTECDKYKTEEILNGTCKYSKYSRGRAKTLAHTHNDYSDNKHYHYSCVLSNVSAVKKNEIIAAKDKVAIKTHIPYYAGLEELF
ncbi:MAG: hypothetical protein HYV59_00670 [Planctomycetes bacterium]|nr:hypothetical protein [Planctomycetota bacterium]